MTDLTDRLARVVELRAEHLRLGCDGTYDAYNVALHAWLRDDAPALLAEVESKRILIADWKALADGWQARAEAAEKVAREAVWLLREADTYVRALAALDGVVPRTIDPNSVSGRISALLAHHVAGTGEGPQNDALRKLSENANELDLDY